MTKKDFLNQLSQALNGLPEKEIEERLSFYSEMIDDRIEEGLSEEEAVAQMGSIEKIVFQIMREIPLSSLVKEKIKPKRNLNFWNILLIMLGFPLWFPILLSVFAVFISVYIVIWCIIIGIWAVVVSLIASALGCAVAFVFSLIFGNPLTAVALLSVSLVLAGISIFGVLFALLCAKVLLFITKKFALWVKSLFLKKGE